MVHIWFTGCSCISHPGDGCDGDYPVQIIYPLNNRNNEEAVQGPDPACSCIPCTGTGILTVGCIVDRRFLDGNCKNSRGNLHHNCGYHTPVWPASGT